MGDKSWMLRAEAGSSHGKPQAGSRERTGMRRIFETSEPTPSDVLPAARPHLPDSTTSWRLSACSMLETMEGISLKPPEVAKLYLV